MTSRLNKSGRTDNDQNNVEALIADLEGEGYHSPTDVHGFAQCVWCGTIFGQEPSGHQPTWELNQLFGPVVNPATDETVCAVCNELPETALMHPNCYSELERDRRQADIERRRAENESLAR